MINIGDIVNIQESIWQDKHAEFSRRTNLEVRIGTDSRSRRPPINMEA